VVEFLGEEKNRFGSSSEWVSQLGFLPVLSSDLWHGEFLAVFAISFFSFFSFLRFLWIPLLFSAPSESHGREVRQMGVGSAAHTRCYHHTHRKPN